MTESLHNILKEMYALVEQAKSDSPPQEDSFEVPQAVRDAATRGLEARRAAPKSKKGGLTTAEAGKEGIGSGVQRASDLRSGRVTKDTIKRMHAFFSRHRKNYELAISRGLKPEESPAIQAWLIWGGEPGRKWAARMVKQWNKLAENRALPPHPIHEHTDTLEKSRVDYERMLKRLWQDAVSGDFKAANDHVRLWQRKGMPDARSYAQRYYDLLQQYKYDYARLLGRTHRPKPESVGDKAAAKGTFRGGEWKTRLYVPLGHQSEPPHINITVRRQGRASEHVKIPVRNVRDAADKAKRFLRQFKDVLIEQRHTLDEHVFAVPGRAANRAGTYGMNMYDIRRKSHLQPAPDPGFPFRSQVASEIYELIKDLTIEMPTVEPEDLVKKAVQASRYGFNELPAEDYRLLIMATETLQNGLTPTQTHTRHPGAALGNWIVSG